jgi:uncharacterized protein YbjT (DUF2867 family)
VRALVHRPVEGLGVQEIIVGDMRLRAVLDQAVQGVRSIYFICPNMSPDEIKMGQMAMAAARSAGVEHFVYHSVLHPQIEAMPHHWQKLRVEEQLFQSGLAVTVLQPAAYMQNLVAYWAKITSEGIYAVPYGVDTRLGMVDLEDVAAVASMVLTQPGHIGAIYELAGAEILTQAEVASILSQQLKRPVQAKAIPLAGWRQNAQKSGLNDYQIDALTKMFSYYDRYGFWGNSRVLRCLLGRAPGTFAEFVERTVRQDTL